jgi:hypothetical protein
MIVFFILIKKDVSCEKSSIDLLYLVQKYDIKEICPICHIRKP